MVGYFNASKISQSMKTAAPQFLNLVRETGVGGWTQHFPNPTGWCNISLVFIYGLQNVGTAKSFPAFFMFFLDPKNSSTTTQSVNFCYKVANWTGTAATLWSLGLTDILTLSDYQEAADILYKNLYSNFNNLNLHSTQPGPMQQCNS